MWGALVHLPATGDHTLSRRDWLTRRLLHHGVAALVLEGPYYGARVPEGQAKSRLRAVTDLFKLGRVTIEEGMRLACWAEGHLTRRVGLAGLSMGGVHACMAASLYPRPVACVPCITPHSAAPPYVMGETGTCVVTCHPFQGATREFHSRHLPLLFRAPVSRHCLGCPAPRAGSRGAAGALCQRPGHGSPCHEGVERGEGREEGGGGAWARKEGCGSWMARFALT